MPVKPIVPGGTTSRALSAAVEAAVLTGHPASECAKLVPRENRSRRSNSSVSRREVEQEHVENAVFGFQVHLPAPARPKDDLPAAFTTYSGKVLMEEPFLVQFRDRLDASPSG
jgi:hypothetical protein